MTYNHAYMRERRKLTTQPEALLRFSRDYARFFMHSNYYYCCSSVMLRAAHFINVIRKRKVCVVCMVHLIISSSSKMKMNHSRCAIATAQSKTTF